MRTSLSLQVQNSLMNISRSTEGLLDAQNRVSTGKRILKASDDVPGTDRSLNLRSAIKTTDQLSDNIVVSTPLLKETDRALNNLASNIRAVQKIAQQAGTANISDPAVKNTFITQLNDLLSETADVANSRYMDQYIFSGTAVNTPAVTQQAGPPPYAYTGDTATRRTQILSWVSIPVNIPGDKVLNFDGSAGAGTTDVFTMITQLRDAISTGTVQDISGQLDNIQKNLDNTLACRSRIGSWMQRMESASKVLDSSKSQLQEMLSDTEDIDLPGAVVQLKTQENIYQAALAVSSRALDLSLATMQR